jgi:hypothetical protein
MIAFAFAIPVQIGNSTTVIKLIKIVLSIFPNKTTKLCNGRNNESNRIPY